MYAAYVPYLPPAPSVGVEVKKSQCIPPTKAKDMAPGTYSLQKGYF